MSRVESARPGTGEPQVKVRTVPYPIAHRMGRCRKGSRKLANTPAGS